MFLLSSSAEQLLLFFLHFSVRPELIFNDFSWFFQWQQSTRRHTFGPEKYFLQTHHFNGANCDERKIKRTKFYWNVSWQKTMIFSTKLKKKKKEETTKSKLLSPRVTNVVRVFVVNRIQFTRRHKKTVQKNKFQTNCNLKQNTQRFTKIRQEW